jgi:hypothetical protein
MMKQILSEKYGLIEGKDVEFINHPSTIFADDTIKINTFDTEKEMFAYVYENVTIKKAMPEELEEKCFYVDKGKIIVKVDSLIKTVDEKNIDIKPVIK